jgi:hypothetical protein
MKVMSNFDFLDVDYRPGFKKYFFYMTQVLKIHAKMPMKVNWYLNLGRMYKVANIGDTYIKASKG